MSTVPRSRVAVVTGAGRRHGLGAAIVRRLASDGCHVVLADMGASADGATPESMIGGREEMHSVAADIADETGMTVVPFECDVRNIARVNELAQFAQRELGSLDIWVNNAGIGYIMKPLLEMQEEDWRAVI